MPYTVRYMTDDDVKEFREQYPQAPFDLGMRWVLKDGEIRLGFFPTEFAALAARKGWETSDHIQDDFEDWRRIKAKEYDVAPEDVQAIVKELLQ